MNIVYAVVFASFIFGGILVQNTKTIKLERKLQSKTIGTFEQTTYRFNNDNTDKSPSFLVEGANIEGHAFRDKEVISKALRSTCNNIFTKMLENGCSNSRDVNIVWGFLKNGSLKKGNISHLWNGASSSTFSCGSEKSYGKYLIRKSLPREIVNRGGYRYDLESFVVGEIKMYPCAYDDIIF